MALILREALHRSVLLVLQRGEADAGAAAGDLDLRAGVLAHVNLRPFLGEDDEGVRAFDGDVAGASVGDKTQRDRRDD